MSSDHYTPGAASPQQNRTSPADDSVIMVPAGTVSHLSQPLVNSVTTVTSGRR